MAQTVDGYLWLGTTSGLVRFDGVRFVDFEPPPGQTLPERNVAALLAMPDGGLWIGFGPGGASLLQRGVITSYSTRDGMPSGTVRALVRDTEGRIWAAALGGLAVLEGSRWKSIGSDWNFSGSATAAMVDHAGTLWVGTTKGVFFLAKGTRRFQPAADQVNYVTHFGEAPDGTIWMAELTREGVRPVPLPGMGRLPPPEIKMPTIAMLFDSQGSLWISSLGQGLRRVPYPERSRLAATGTFVPEDAFTVKQGLSSDFMESIFEDSEGDIWVGTNAGLDRFRQSSLVPIQYPATPGYMSLMAAERGDVWSGIVIDRIWVIRGRRFLPDLPPEMEPLRKAQSNCLYRDPQGVIWLGTTKKLLRFTNGRLDQIDYPPAPASTDTDRAGSALTMTSEKSGRLWASIMGLGVFRLEDHWHWTSLQSLGGPKGMAICSFTDSDGRVWFGFSDKTMVMVNGGSIQVLPPNDIRIGRVRCIHGRSSKVWIGGDDGVAMFDGGRFRPLLASGGFHFRDVFGIVETANDGLWFSDHSGVIHVPKDEMELFKKEPGHPVNFQSFSRLDGLPEPLLKSSVVPAVVEGTDGTLWFATNRGVTWVDPHRISKNTVPPPVSIEAVVADGKQYDPTAHLALPANTANLNITYTGISLSMPERVWFRYKLEGSSQDWQDAGNRREAIYTNPGPGSYRFRVIAGNQDGVWNAAGAVLTFSIAPAYYQTIWFEVLCGLALAGLLWLLYLLRLKQVTAQVQARLGERLVERERIARELHDTLLQGFNGLVLRFQAVMKQIPPDAPARQMMESALNRADDVLLEGRLRVRDLRSEAATGNELAEGLAKCGEELAKEGAEEFSVAIIGAPRLLDPIVLDEVHRIGREALVNAFRHAHASKIEVEITYHPTRFQLRVRDDGCGIDPNVLENGRPGHWGLAGVRERAQNIGGQLSIWSNKGAGTELELVIPAKVAYRRGAKPSTWGRLKRAMLGGESDHARAKED
jgi:signal transduction histidine kinase/ligand-binding sensor domain-containing protein